MEGREWWLWGFAVAVTLVLTFGMLSLTFSGFHLPGDDIYSRNLKEWVGGLAALVLLFDIYTADQHLQLQRIRRQLLEREQLFHLITENAADMIAVVDGHGRLGLNVVAGGIENAEQMEMLKHFGCELGQGYLFSRPGAADAIEHFLTSQNAHAALTQASTANQSLPRPDRSRAHK
jgi:c-di-GMP-related signal transduction protein